MTLISSIFFIGLFLISIGVGAIGTAVYLEEAKKTIPEEVLKVPATKKPTRQRTRQLS